MESQKHDWASAHAQLWTSFKKAQREEECLRKMDSADAWGTNKQGHAREPDCGLKRDVTLSILREVMQHDSVRGPVFSEELEGHISTLLESDSVPKPIQDLLAAVMHLKGRIEESEADAACKQKYAANTAEDILFHLVGDRALQKAGAHKNGGSSVPMDNDSLFLTALIQVEKCKERVRRLSERYNLSKPFDKSSSLQEMLDTMYMLSPSARPAAEDEDSSSALVRQVMDILGASPAEKPAQAPQLALKAVKDMEMVRRENQKYSALLHQYEKTVLNKFASCGVVFPPTVEQVRAELLSNGYTSDPPQDDQWISKQLKLLVSVMVEVSENCHLHIVPSHIQNGASDLSGTAMLEYMRSTLDVARELLAVLGTSEVEAKSLLVGMLQKLTGIGNVSEADEGEAVSPSRRKQTELIDEKCTFMEVVKRLGHAVDRQYQQHGVKAGYSEGDESKVIEALKRILRYLPFNDSSIISDEEQAKSARLSLLKDEDALADYVETEVRRLVLTSNIPETVLQQVKDLKNQIASLTSSVASDGTHKVDQQTLLALRTTAAQLQQWVAGEHEAALTAADSGVIQQCICELAQLLPTGVPPSSNSAVVEIEPPVNNLLGMVRLLKSRQEQWIQEQHKQQLQGAHSRMEKTRMEEVVRERGRQLLRLCRDILMGTVNSKEAEEVLGTITAELTHEGALLNDGATEGNGESSGSAVCFSISATFDDLEERLKLIKTRYHRLQQAFTANKVRVDNLSRFNASRSKRWQRICQNTAAICRAVGLVQTADHLEQEFKLDIAQDTVSQSTTTSAAASLFKRTLRPEQQKTAVPQPINDADLLEALKLIEVRLKESKELRDKAEEKASLVRLQDERKRWKEEVRTFGQAIEVILTRLAETGRRIKRSLFMLGTDECAEDEVVETVLKGQLRYDEGGDMDYLKEVEEGNARVDVDVEKRRRREEGRDVVEGVEEQENKSDSERQQRRQEVNEETLAVLLQKFDRWATRLVETTEDHLYSQKKLSKYFAAMHRFFCSNDKAAGQQDVTDENLIDIDTILMRFADEILPVLDRAAVSAHASRIYHRQDGRAANTENSADDARASRGSNNNIHNEALSLLMQNAPSSRVLPVDHRIARLYESVGKMRTMVAGLLSVRYLAIPSAATHRRSGSGEELKFNNGFDDSRYIELDIGKMKMPTYDSKGCGDQIGDLTTENAPLHGDSGTLYANDDQVIQALEVNLSGVYQALSKFSTNYKLAAILIQKDTEMVQQFIAAMLEQYLELDIQRAFGQKLETLQELYVIISERAKRQHGCYFFSRVGGEGPCVWAVALEQLSAGFVGILEKLRKRTEVATELRELVDDVMDSCATYVNWVNDNENTIRALHPLPEDVVVTSIRCDTVESTDVRRPQQEEDCMRGESMQRPPLPSGNCQSRVSYFSRDNVVLKVIDHMFSVAREAANFPAPDKTQQLEEQLQLLRETVAVAEQARERALSEAAVSRAELRRWKKQHNLAEELSSLSSPQKQADTSSSHGCGGGSKEDALIQVAQVMKELTKELRGARCRGASGTDTGDQFMLPEEGSEGEREREHETRQRRSPQKDFRSESAQKHRLVECSSPLARRRSPHKFSSSDESGLLLSHSGRSPVLMEQQALQSRLRRGAGIAKRDGNETFPHCNSIVVSPNESRYSTMGRGSPVRRSPSEALLLQHYKACGDVEKYFNDCSVCIKQRHAPRPRSANRDHTPGKPNSRTAARALSPALLTSTRVHSQRKHADTSGQPRTISTLPHYRQSASVAGLLHVPRRQRHESPQASQYDHRQVRSRRSLERGPKSPTTAATPLLSDEDHDGCDAIHAKSKRAASTGRQRSGRYVLDSFDCDRRNMNSTHSLSTSTVLSPESTTVSTREEHRQADRPMRRRHASTHGEVGNRRGLMDLSESLDVLQERTGYRTRANITPSRSGCEQKLKATSRQAAVAPMHRSGPTKKNRIAACEQATSKLTDVVARTKVRTREEF
ncbi:hypothetical protein ERJ75_000421300 [Trypanosoma vivax]|uniref:Uncharacterized protein n=1 Tax=Trypanosoma vivax (strain Y486) TaxID=1055687 RepID=G0TV42_TRYVY|nr:hypothetical protein ERJ75_000421300 [Trypanosoma vivax]CCC47807.1 conserved hypothetical protein [Trypanosoma vivax Y486]